MNTYPSFLYFKTSVSAQDEAKQKEIYNMNIRNPFSLKFFQNC
jgi:hypothetical protein